MDVFDSLQRYNVAWTSPSRDVSGSMPLGNGDLGANVWVEENGDLLLLLAKSDAWDENSINLKLGRIRLKISPTPDIQTFRQTLRLATGDVEIVIGAVRILVWADANEPVLYIDAESDSAFELRANLEMWRTEPRTIKTQTGDLFKRLDGPDPHPTVVSPDHLLEETDRRVVWCHHNEPREHDGFEINLKLQGLGEMLERMPHPLRGRTFGAVMTRPTGPASKHRIAIHALTLHPATIEQWREAIDRQVGKIESRPAWVERSMHEQWWRAFWNRSWIHVPQAFEVSRAYVLQRFMNAAGGRGAQPIKFNGSLFTVGKPDDPDFRRWGGPGFWFMNQRLIYWPMLAAGDFDLIFPWLSMYLDMLPLQRHRTQKYFGHGGAHFPETITFWGAEVSAHYGWTPFEQRAHPEAECSYVTYYWTCGLELTLILHAYFEHAQDIVFARQFLLPIADAVTEFYDLHYPRDAAGKLRIEPSQALETWQDATNPTPDLAGLQYVLPKLLELPDSMTTDAMRTRWRRMLGELPDIPVGEKQGQPVICPAERFDKKKNTENPELYAVFPFRVFGVGKPNLELARNTFAARLHQSHDCWSQDDVQMAYLGLVEQAKDYLTKRASPASHSDSRFPAFWNAFHDWIPDMDHGGVLQLALQAMLMQTEGSEILLLPSWPKEWDCDFKLHAPQQTIVEGTVRQGRLTDLHLTPAHRRADVKA
jgi:hypothetical protein